MIWSLFSLERLYFDLIRGEVCYQDGGDSKKQERMASLERIAWVSFHVLDKAQVMVRRYWLFSNALRGKMYMPSVDPSHPSIIEEEEQFIPSC